MKYRIIVIAWSVVFVIMAVIFMFSSQPSKQSDKVSTGVTEIIVNTLPETRNLPDKDKNVLIAKSNEYVRKYAHVALYFILGLAITYALSVSIDYKNPLYLCIVAFMICLIYSVTDELHQLFVPGRGCQASDVLIDSGGAMVGCAVIAVIKRFKCKAHLIL